VNFVDPLGLCEDGEKYVQDYTKALKKNPYSWPYVRSVVNEYDIKLADELSHIDRTWSFRGEKYKSDVMGNIAPAYAATMVYGPIVSPVLMVGAEIMYDRPKGISAKIKAATGSFKMNAVGIKEAVKDTIKDMFGAR